MAKPIPKLGRSLIFSDADELLDCFYDYIDDCIINNWLPNMAGFRAKKVIPKSTLFEYEQREAFSDAFNIIRDVLENETLQSKDIDPSTKKLVLQSKYNYVDKINTVTTNTNIDIQADDDFLDTIRKKYLTTST